MTKKANLIIDLWRSGRPSLERLNFLLLHRSKSAAEMQQLRTTIQARLGAGYPR